MAINQISSVGLKPNAEKIAPMGHGDVLKPKQRRVETQR
jgi:hypothetical protein